MSRHSRAIASLVVGADLVADGVQDALEA